MPLYLYTVVKSYVSTEEKNLDLLGSHNSIHNLVMKFNLSAYSKTPHPDPFTLTKLTKSSQSPLRSYLYRKKSSILRRWNARYSANAMPFWSSLIH